MKKKFENSMMCVCKIARWKEKICERNMWKVIELMLI